MAGILNPTASQLTKGSVSDAILREAGNKFYLEKKFNEAIECYSDAIKINPCNPTTYLNRGMSILFQGNMHCHQLAYADFKKAVEMDPIYVKAHYFLGRTLSDLNLLDEAIFHVQRAYELSKEQRLNLGDDVARTLRQLRKKRFLQNEETRIQDGTELQKYLKNLVIEDHAERKGDTKSQPEVDELNPMKRSKTENSKVDPIQSSLESKLNAIDKIFSQIDEKAKKREVPDYLCGKISFELLKDPVITPSGITYERKDIEEHLMRVGHFDPVTRVALTADQLIPNYVMKEVVDAYVAENPWALDM